LLLLTTTATLAATRPLPRRPLPPLLPLLPAPLLLLLLLLFAKLPPLPEELDEEVVLFVVEFKVLSVDA
jgi:hypothetical protein